MMRGENDSEDADVITIEDGFLAENAEFFANGFAPLNSVFENSGEMTIVSEESEMTVAVGVRQVGGTGELEVDCILLKPNQESLQACFDTPFTEETG